MSTKNPHLKRTSALLSPRNVRRISPAQAKCLNALADQVTTKLFGDVTVEEVANKCFVTYVIEYEPSKIGAAICLHTYPNIPSIPPWDWDNWLHNLYGMQDAGPRNTLWIHMLVYDNNYSLFLMKPMLRYIFKEDRFLKYIFLVVPPNGPHVDIIELVATRLYPKGWKPGEPTQSLFMVCRENFTFQYSVRRAVEEDNDDVVPLIHSNTKKLVQMYGEYYIAEILRDKDSERQIIVAEFEGSAVSVLVVNGTVNYEVLNQQFELTPYNGLKKMNADDHFSLFEEKSSRTQLPMETLAEMHDLFASLNKEDAESIISAITLQIQTTNSVETLIHASGSSSQYSIMLTTSSLSFFNDSSEDELDESGSLHTTNEQKTEESGSDEGSQWTDAGDDTTLNTSDSISGINSRIFRFPGFYGEDNAFTLEVVAAHPDHEYSLFLLLEAVFECFPERDYCLINLPTDSPAEPWCKYFVRVVERITGTFPAMLYVLHRNVVLGQLEVKPLEEFHAPQITRLVSTIPQHAILVSQMKSYLEDLNSPYQSYVVLCEEEVIGVAHITEEHSRDYLEAHFNILTWVEPQYYRSGDFGAIETMVLSPCFQCFSQYILTEFHRLADYRVLFYKNRPNQQNKEQPVVNVLSWMTPVMPRKIPDYDLAYLREEGYPPAEVITRRKELYALYLSTVALCSIPRYVVNTRIVVFGCSNTALSFLESILCADANSSYMTIFNNVTLICSHGLQQKVSRRVNDTFMVKKNFLTAKYIEMIGLRSYVTVVNGPLTSIQRKEKCIVINHNSMLRYDLLFLMCGDNFQRPLQNYQEPFKERPDNVFIINCAMDAGNLIYKLRTMKFMSSPENIIIVYGHYLQVYSCLAGLRSLGIPGSQIVLVQPFPYSTHIDKRQRHNISVFNDIDIYCAVMNHTSSEGIKIYTSYYFIDWTYDASSNIITSAKFESKHKVLELKCEAIVFFFDKGISPSVHKVINKAGLVIDGRLVIDHNCRTHDVSIYGAGTLTKYSRTYYADNMVHKNFNRVEIGHLLGQQIKNMIVPASLRKMEPDKVNWNLHLPINERSVKRYEEPIMRYCKLPGGLYYLSITAPGRQLPFEIASAKPNYGEIFITGNVRDLSEQGGFFKLHINEFDRVETITCLSKNPIAYKNLYCIWGMPERLLNNLRLRFEMQHIPNFFKYFKEAWAYAIFHDRFQSFMRELNHLMTSPLGTEWLIDKVNQKYEAQKWQKLNQDTIDEIEEIFDKSLYRRITQELLMNFIEQNLKHLTMYAHPVVIRRILEGYENSPLFTKQ